MTLNIYRQGLTSISGFDLKNITKIDCSENNLTALELTGDSTRMLDIRCYSNKINMLPIMPENLCFLYCDNNCLEQLDLSMCLSLEVLACYNNKLTEIKLVSKKLRNLDCRNNKLECLPYITRNLKYLNCDEYLLLKDKNFDWSTGTHINDFYQEMLVFKMLKEIYGEDFVWYNIVSQYQEWLYRVGGEKYNEAKNALN